MQIEFLREQANWKKRIDELEGQIRHSEERYRIALSDANIGVWEYDIKTRTLLRAQSASSLDFVPQVMENVPDSLVQAGYVTDDSALKLQELYAQLAAGVKHAQADITIQFPDGKKRWERASYTTVFDEENRPVRAIGISEDVTRQKEMELRYQQEQQLQTHFPTGFIAGFRANLTKNTVDHLHTCKHSPLSLSEEMSFEELQRNLVSTMVNADEIKRYGAAFTREAMLREFARGKALHSMDYRRKSPAGKILWVNTTFRVVHDPETGDIFAYNSIRTIDQKKYIELALDHRAEKDPVTGLYNKDTFLRMLHDALRSASGNKQVSAFLLFSIDDFGEVIRRRGYLDSDRMIQELGEAIQSECDTPNIVGRLYGGVLAAWCGNVQSIKQPIDAADRVRQILLSMMPEERIAVSAAVVAVKAGELSHSAILNRGLETLVQCQKSGGNYTEVLLEPGKEDETNAEADVAEQARYRDSLTGLLNRNSYLQYVDHLIPEALISLGIISLDINGLKYVNTHYGHAEGDQVVCRTAQVMQKVFYEAQVFRLAGDEFLVIYENFTAEAIEERIKALTEQVEKFHSYGVSSGFVWSSTEINMLAMTQESDERMMVAKRRYYKEVGVMAKHHDPKAEKALLEDITAGRYEMFLQPKASVLNNMVTGAEALVRYRDKNGTIVSPDRFIPGLEQDGLIHHIDFFILRSVCETLHRWAEEGRQLMPISLNFSRATLLSENLIQNMEEILQKYQVPKKFVEIEITESLGSVERETVIRIGSKIVEHNYKLALDDFGAKYSNLSILSAMKFHVLKIDKSLVNDLFSNQNTRVIIKNFLATCRELGIASVAEGVETQEQLSTLKALGCDVAQGFFFNKPIPLADFENLYLRK